MTMSQTPTDLTLAEIERLRVLADQEMCVFGEDRCVGDAEHAEVEAIQTEFDALMEKVIAAAKQAVLSKGVVE